VYWAQGKYATAEEEFKKAYASLDFHRPLNEDSFDREYLRAACLYRMRPRPETLDYPPQLLMAYTNNPSHPFPWRGDEQQLQQATSILGALVHERPDEPKYQYLLAQCLCVRSAELQLTGGFVDIDEGIRLLRKLIANQPDVANNRFSLGSSLAGMAKLAPRFDRSKLSLVQHRLTEIETLLDEVVREHPEVVAFAETLARVDWHLGDGSDSRRTRLMRSLKLFQMLEARHPEQDRFHLWHALLLLTQAQINAITEDREKAPEGVATAIKILESIKDSPVDTSTVLRKARE